VITVYFYFYLKDFLKDRNRKVGKDTSDILW